MDQPYWIQQHSLSNYGQANQAFSAEQMQVLLGYRKQEKTPMINGTKPLVVCGGDSIECKDLDEAQQKAEELAHQKNTTAYILKPVKKVAPKRDVVTTDL